MIPGIPFLGEGDVARNVSTFAPDVMPVFDITAQAEKAGLPVDVYVLVDSIRKRSASTGESIEQAYGYYKRISEGYSPSEIVNLYAAGEYLGIGKKSFVAPLAIAAIGAYLLWR